MERRPNRKDTNHGEAVLNRISAALQGLEFGTIQVTVHNSRVVQIDRLERVRLLPEDSQQAGSGI